MKTLREYLIEEKNRANLFGSLRGKIIAAVAILLMAAGISKGQANPLAADLVGTKASSAHVLVTDTTNSVSEFLKSKGIDFPKDQIKEKLQGIAEGAVEKGKELGNKAKQVYKESQKVDKVLDDWLFQDRLEVYPGYSKWWFEKDKKEPEKMSIHDQEREITKMIIADFQKKTGLKSHRDFGVLNIRSVVDDALEELYDGHHTSSSRTIIINPNDDVHYDKKDDYFKGYITIDRHVAQYGGTTTLSIIVHWEYHGRR